MIAGSGWKRGWPEGKKRGKKGEGKERRKKKKERRKKGGGKREKKSKGFSGFKLQIYNIFDFSKMNFVLG